VRSVALRVSRPKVPGAYTRIVGSLRQEPSLDGLRAVAVVGVLVYHACAIAQRGSWFSGGFLGVSLFFVISGYLMTTLLLAEKADTGTIDAARFAARRVKRLQPASLVVVAAAIVLAVPGWTAWSGFHATDALAAVWGWMNWQVIALGEGQVLRGIGPVGPYWSLAVEMQFYVALSLLSLPMRRSAVPRRWLWAFASLSFTTGAVMQLFVHGNQLQREFSTGYRVAELAAGMLLALLLGHRHRSSEHSSSTSLAVLGAAVLLAVVVSFVVADFDPPWLLSGGFAAYSFLCAALVHIALRSQVWRRLLGHRMLVAVGHLSYSLYLVHWPVALLVVAHFHHPGVATIVLTLALTTVAAVLLHRFVEQPLRRREASTRSTLLWGLGASAAVSLMAITLLP